MWQPQWHICPMWRVLCLILCLSACTQFPELDATVPAEADAAAYPDLVPLLPVLASADATPERQSAVEQSLEGRIARLRNRADRLRGNVIDRRTRARMARGVTQG